MRITTHESCRFLLVSGVRVLQESGRPLFLFSWCRVLRPLHRRWGAGPLASRSRRPGVTSGRRDILDCLRQSGAVGLSGYSPSNSRHTCTPCLPFSTVRPWVFSSGSTRPPSPSPSHVRLPSWHTAPTTQVPPTAHALLHTLPSPTSSTGRPLSRRDTIVHPKRPPSPLGSSLSSCSPSTS